MNAKVTRCNDAMTAVTRECSAKMRRLHTPNSRPYCTNTRNTYILHKLNDITSDNGVGINPKHLLGIVGQELVHNEADVVGSVCVDLHTLLTLVLSLALVVGVGELFDVVLDGGLGQVDVLHLGKGGEGIVTDEVELHPVGSRGMRLDGADGGLDSGDGVKVRCVHDVDKIVAILLLVGVEGVVHGAETAAEGGDGGRCAAAAATAVTQSGGRRDDGRGEGDARGAEDERSLATLVAIAAVAGRLGLGGDIIVGKDAVLYNRYLLLRLLLELELGIVFVQGRHDDKWHELCWLGQEGGAKRYA